VRWALAALRADPRSRVLVHCSAGVHRSSAMAYALLRAMGVGAHDAWRNIRRARPVVKDRYLRDAEGAVRAGFGP
jgi:predicted protein tyrosine phosphatase